MKGSLSYWFLTCVVLLLSACGETAAPRLDALAEMPVYEDSVYCFNERSIVTLNGLKGIVDKDGNPVLLPEWNEVEFLDDNVALLSKSGIWSLCTRDGRIFAQSADSLYLEGRYSELYEEMAESDAQYWNQVLDTLEELEELCLTARSGQLDERMIHAHATLQRLLEASPGGAMTASQRERLESIEADFKTMYRR